MTMLVMARPRRGMVGERERRVHLFDAHHHRTANGNWIALCNKRFNMVDLEALDDVTGMPCEVCLIRAARASQYRELYECGDGSALKPDNNREPRQSISQHDDGSVSGEPNREVATATHSTIGEESGWNSRKFDPDGNPLRYRYEQLADHLARMITTGEIPPGKPLPAERRLADEYGVALGTAQRAIKELRIRGLVITMKSKETLVLPVNE